jgi:hypothetical protein
MTIAWPADLLPSQCEFFLQHNTTVFTSPLTRRQQVLRRQGEKWRCALKIGPTNRAKGQRIDALLAKLKGAYNTVALWDFARPTPSGDNRLAGGVTDATVLGAHTAGATSIATTGWYPSITGILLAGDYIGIGGALYALTDDANSDGSNHATLLIAPPLKADAAGGSIITRTQPTTVFQLIDDTQPKREVADMLYTYALSFAEAI